MWGSGVYSYCAMHMGCEVVLVTVLVRVLRIDLCGCGVCAGVRLA